MSLRSLPPTTSFNTSTNGLLTEFLIPALGLSKTYDRGVGYFTSHWLKMAASGLVGLAANGGTARIIASPKLSAEDSVALQHGLDAQSAPALHAALQRTLEELELDLQADTLSALAWMVADGFLVFKLAVPTAELDGDFHDKFGTFSDGADAVAFRGSPNDSERAFRNYESISAYYSWVDEREAQRVRDEQTRFELLWDNKDPNLRTYELPDAFKRNLIEITKRTARPYARGGVAAPDDQWRHQTEALAAFISARRGVLEMATGTGKTRTAISILLELHERGLVQGAVISAFGTDLLDQWYKELVRRTPFAIYRDYDGRRESLSFLNAPTHAILLMSRQNLGSVLPKMGKTAKASTLLVCDEVHGMGSAGVTTALSGKLDDFVFRLGLSATPERAYDDAGNDFIEKEIGPVIFRFTLEQAIQRGILCEFDYVELEYAYSDEDRASVRQALRRHHGSARSSEPRPIEQLFQELARIRKLSVEKIAPFRRFVGDHPDVLNRCLIFVETAEYGALVQDVLMAAGSNYHTYYGDDDRTNLTRFASGELDCLVTCKRISEGIDISSVGAIALFATARARLETVQRLGRCLRIDPANPGKRATVIDFIRTDDLDEEESTFEGTADTERRDWFRELATQRFQPPSRSDVAMHEADL
jgi:superfamily II DNA or RNA helicase